MPRRKTTNRRILPGRSSSERFTANSPLPPKAWTFLIYLCGDNHLAKYLDSDFEEICRAGSLPDIHVVVQHDRPDGARRYLLRQGQPAEPENLGRVNTGDPREAVAFLRWGIEQAPSERVVVIFNGPGINPNYLAQNLSRKGGTEIEYDLAARVEQRLFSICHDRTSGDALETHELRAILESLTEKLGRPIDLVCLDMGAAAFVEIAYQMEGLAQVLVASQRFVPDNGWPYDKILTRSQERVAKNSTGAQELARLIVETVADHYKGDYPEDDVRLAAFNLAALEDASRALDTLALALMQSLGDWHVLDAVCKAAEPLQWIKAELPEDQTAEATKLAQFLPAVDLFELLERTHQELTEKIEEVPEDYGQRHRVKHLADLTEKALKLLREGSSAESRLLLYARPKSNRGLSILLPRPRTQEEVDKGTGVTYNPVGSNYLDLNFSQRVHWAALVGAFQLIIEKPHVLWRIISSMLADASAPARDALMQRLLSPDSVMQGLERQFRSLGEDRVLTLSLDPREVSPGSERRTYRLLLESTVAGATVAQQESRVYQPSMDTALRGLEQLLDSLDDNPDVLRDLEAFGLTLGEDLIQDLADRLEAERRAATEGAIEETPHLRLQIPSELMRYPWELMFDRRGMLCERYAMGRQVFMGTQLTKRVMRRKPGPIEVLIIGDPKFTPEFREQFEKERRRQPPQLRGAEQEAREVADEFERLRDEMAGLPPLRITRLIGATLTVNEFRQRLREGTYDIIHYAGHACFDKGEPEASAWLLSDGLLRAREIRNTLAWTGSPPWLVFANACEAGMDAGAVASRYQGDVFGLATAFINQGVAAYIAPLWEVDDEVATQLAIDFYRGLLLDRLSLGEALREARVLAKQEWASPPRAVASWASMVLYGDPTPRLLESLWTPHAERAEKQKREAKKRHERAEKRRRSPRLAKATVEQTVELASGPDMQLVSPEPTRGETPVPPGSAELKLMEYNGIRYWATVDEQGQLKPLRGSELSKSLEGDKSENVRGMLGPRRGLRDYPRGVARWVIGKFMGTEKESLILRLVEQYDSDVVKTERLWLINPDSPPTPLPQRPAQWEWLTDPLKEEDRVLLIIHGTFGKTDSLVKGLRRGFFDWAYSKYRGVIGFDHWTLSKTPEDNARMLWDLLDPRLHDGHRLDIITHSRGGLVARAFVELLGHGKAVRRVIFVGTPNGGTNLANPENWGQAADWLLNLVHADPTGMYGRLSGLLARLLVSGLVGEIPGLQAQNPKATGDQQFLGRLQEAQPLPKGVTYAAVAANYEPGEEEFNLKTVSKKALDGALDKFYGGPNDLVVDTASVWALDTAKSLDQTGQMIPAQRLLLFNPDGQVPNPPGTQLEEMSGVHHTNLFTWQATQNFLRQQLA